MSENMTTEALVAKAMRESWSDELEYTDAPEAVTAALRAAGLLVEGAPTDEQVNLIELQRLADASTPGPWKYHETIQADNHVTAGGGILTGTHVCGPTYERHNARFIAASRDAVPSLIRRVRELEAALAAAGVASLAPTDEQIETESWGRFPVLDPDYASMTYPAEAMRTYNRAAFVSGARWAAADVNPQRKTITHPGQEASLPVETVVLFADGVAGQLDIYTNRGGGRVWRRTDATYVTAFPENLLPAAVLCEPNATAPEHICPPAPVDEAKLAEVIEEHSAELDVTAVFEQCACGWDGLHEDHPSHVARSVREYLESLR